MWVICQVFDWFTTVAFFFFAFFVMLTPRARLHPIISFLLAWGLLMYGYDYFFVQFGHTSFGGHDYSSYLPLLCPLFAVVTAIILPFAPFTTEFTLVGLVIMMIAGWYNFDTTLSVGFVATFVILMIVGFLRIAYIMQVFVIAFTVAGLLAISGIAMLLEIDVLRGDLELDPVCDNHVNLILICDIRCSNVLNDPDAVMHSAWVILFLLAFVFRLLGVWRYAPDIHDAEQMKAVCWCCPWKCCRRVQVNTSRAVEPPGPSWRRPIRIKLGKSVRDAAAPTTGFAFNYATKAYKHVAGDQYDEDENEDEVELWEVGDADDIDIELAQEEAKEQQQQATAEDDDTIDEFMFARESYTDK